MGLFGLERRSRASISGLVFSLLILFGIIIAMEFSQSARQEINHTPTLTATISNAVWRRLIEKIEGVADIELAEIREQSVWVVATVESGHSFTNVALGILETAQQQVTVDELSVFLNDGDISEIHNWTPQGWDVTVVQTPTPPAKR